MSILMIEYRVDDFAGWKAMFDADPLDRGSHGVSRHWINRDRDDPNHHVLTMELASHEQATAFREAMAPVWDISGAGQSWILEQATEIDAPDEATPTRQSYFVYRLNPPRATFPADITADEAAIMEQHFAYWKPHEANGTLVVLGPVLDPTGTWGLGVLAAESGDDVMALVAEDPAVKSGMSTFEVCALADPFIRQ